MENTDFLDDVARAMTIISYMVIGSLLTIGILGIISSPASVTNNTSQLIMISIKNIAATIKEITL